MSDQAATLNAVIRAEAPALHACLSDLGRGSFFPADIPFQSAQAHGARYNATIGQMTDGLGVPLALPSMAAALQLSRDDVAAGFLYSPIAGLPEVRRRWRDWQRREVPETMPSSLPIVTAGLSHGIALAADLFCGHERPVALAAPLWGNYRQIFGLRRGGRLLEGAFFRDGRFNPFATSQALAGEAPGQPALTVVNIPHNPGGYAPTAAERRALVDDLLREADRRPLTVVFDDAYSGLVYEPGIPGGSLFWEVAGRHPNLVAVKADGATKEFAFFGGRVGFLTFDLHPESTVAAALEDKVKGLIRSSIGSPGALSQVVLLAGLRNSGAAAEIEAVRLTLEERYHALRRALESVDPGCLTALPFNAGCFALLALPDGGPDPEALRRHLLDHWDTGVVAIPPRYVRLAFCSLGAAEIPELVRRVERAVAELRAAKTADRGVAAAP